MPNSSSDPNDIHHSEKVYALLIYVGAVVSYDLCAPVGKRVCMVRAHNCFDFRNELSVEHHRAFFELLRPLLFAG